MLRPFDIQEQLSHAFMHMIASCAACTYTPSPRPLDNEGVDATIRFQLDLPEENETQIDSLPIEVQLKSTRQQLTRTEKGISFQLDAACYNRFRKVNVMAQRLLILLHLPPDQNDWVTVEPEKMTSRNCVYWVSLRGAPKIDEGNSSITVHFPEKNILTPSVLNVIVEQLSKGKMISHA
ncbi:MAG: DUF4365 domain-containing protein [Pirellulaceae bacterium]|nr:DUF4365 domain-containing protein [Pirellulaceae bacterium]